MQHVKPVNVGLWIFTTLSIITLFVIVLKREFAPPSFVYVDAQKLTNGYKGMIQARKEFEYQVAMYKSNLDSLRSEIEGTVKKLDETKGSLSPKEKSLMAELIQAKQNRYFEYEKVVNDKISTADKELSNKVLTKINNYLKVYAKQFNYEIILAATQYGNIAYANPEIDITDEVLEELNKDFEANAN